MQHIKILVLCNALLCCGAVTAEALATTTPTQHFDFNQQAPADILDIEYDTQEKEYSTLSNQLYQTERFRVFNYMAYDSQQLSAQAKSGSLDNISQLSISFGYGVEFLVNSHNKIGYEYISSFPYDRGQLVRLFWVRAL